MFELTNLYIRQFIYTIDIDYDRSYVSNDI